MEVHHALLTAREPYSLDASLRALTGFAPAARDQAIAGDRVRRAFTRPGQPDRAVVVDIAPPPHGSGVALTVFADAPLAADQAAAVETAVRRWLSLDDDLLPFLAIARTDPAMAPILAVTEGLHQVRFASWAEAVVYFALTQRSTQWQAAARKRRIAADLGPRLAVDGVTHTAFPELPGVLAADLADYTGAGRAPRLRAVIEGATHLDPDWLRTADFAAATEALLAVRGIGPFTANALLLRALGRPDDTPLEMAQFGQAARTVYGPEPPSPAQLRERYGRYVGWWAYFCRTGLAWLDHATASRPAMTEA